MFRTQNGCFSIHYYEPSMSNSFSQPAPPLSRTRIPLLSRSMTAPETWGFGLTGHLTWLSTAPTIHAALGPQAMLAWLPGVIIGMLINFQVQRLGQANPDVAGGTPNYVTILFKKLPGLGRFAAIGYFFSWVGFIPINAIVLTDLINVNLAPVGLHAPDLLFKIGFTVIAVIMAFTGTRALGILHLFFILPAFGLLFVFCLQGLGWLAFSPVSPGFFPTSWSGLTFGEWAKWFFFAIFATYSCESATAFVADSKRPGETLRFLKIASWLIALVYLGGSWILMRLATDPALGTDVYASLLQAAQPFWGNSASLLITFLLVSASLLGSATAAANTPRILYQMSLDGHLAPVFSAVSQRGVLGPSLVFVLLLSLLCLAWGDIDHIVVVTGTGWFACFILLHLGLWLRRDRPEVRWPWLSLGFFGLESLAFVVGGWNWGWQDFLLGLGLPIAILMADQVVRRVPWAPLRPDWWMRRYHFHRTKQIKDFVAFQVVILIVLVCSATAIGWGSRAAIAGSYANSELLMIILLTIAFIAIAIACWTSLPQVVAIAEAQAHAEDLFITALDTVPDTILVVNETGTIRQSNPAAAMLFQVETQKILGTHLNHYLWDLSDDVSLWPSQSEHIFDVIPNYPSAQRNPKINKDHRVIETTISQRTNRKLQEYIVILRDITDRKQSEQALRHSESALRQQTHQLEHTLQELQQTQAQLIQTEKMSSLGQLVAGVAHEINNPVNFIHGNLTHINRYTRDLLELTQFCQQRYAASDNDLQTLVEDIDLDFLEQDLPKVLSSMQVGTERIRQIILTLRNFSRLDESDMKLVNIHDGIESTLLILQARWQARASNLGIEIIKEYGDLPLVECYAGQLNQVFMNVISNAIDALKEIKSDGDINTTGDRQYDAKTIKIRTQLFGQDWVRISIIDSGVGMTEAVMAKIFDPFFTTKDVGEGTGLGLSISYKIIVDKHEGQLKCCSQPGQGTEFQIEIPTRQSQPSRQKIESVGVQESARLVGCQP